MIRNIIWKILCLFSKKCRDYQKRMNAEMAMFDYLKKYGNATIDDLAKYWAASQGIDIE